MNHVVETFTEAERARLAPHFTNLDRPVFALVNLPETVKGALFARYSRYPGTLRRLFLDEFADSLPEIAATYDDAEGERAAKLYETIFLGYGDDSVAQLGGAHIACEWVSNVLTKILQRPRLGAYLEQSPCDRLAQQAHSQRRFVDLGEDRHDVEAHRAMLSRRGQPEGRRSPVAPRGRPRPQCLLPRAAAPARRASEPPRDPARSGRALRR